MPATLLPLLLLLLAVKNAALDCLLMAAAGEAAADADADAVRLFLLEDAAVRVAAAAAMDEDRELLLECPIAPERLRDVPESGVPGVYGVVGLC